MVDRKEAWQLFFERWSGATQHIPRVSASPDRPGQRSAGFIPIDAAREATLEFLADDPAWDSADAKRLTSCFALEVVIWAHLDGIDRDRLASRLHAVQSRVHPSRAGDRELHEAELGRVRPVRLPEAFYLPALDATGHEVRDTLPWPDAVEYVSDGTRYGMRLREGEIRWFEEAPRQLMDLLEQDFQGLDLAGIVEGLKEYIARRDPLPLALAHEVAALEAVVIERRRTAEEPA